MGLMQFMSHCIFYVPPSQEYSVLSNVYTVFCVLMVPHELSGFELNCWGVTCQKLRFTFL